MFLDLSQLLGLVSPDSESRRVPLEGHAGFHEFLTFLGLNGTRVGRVLA